MSSSKVAVLTALVIMVASPTGRTGLPLFNDCRQCHRDIFNLWKGSLHGQSYTDPSFQAAYLTTMLERGDDASEHCLRCHAPLAHRRRDFDLKSDNATEGVGCSFCHSIASVKGNQIDSCYQLDTAGVVYGPYPPTDNPIEHESRLSPLHQTADLCAGCHEFTNEHGVKVLGTYSEWSASPYPAKQIQCQNCHMPMMYDLSVVDDQEIPNWFVTAHEFRGGHSKINLTHAVDLKTEVTQSGRRCTVVVSITNAESGHKLPTGVPVRKLVLNVVMKTNYDYEIGSARKVYRKVLTDEYGTILETVPDMFLNATRIFSDNRIEPKETRVETFVFEIPAGISDFNIETTLKYEYSRHVLSEELVSVEMSKNIVSSDDID
jgi:hypothetical protein